MLETEQTKRHNHVWTLNEDAKLVECLMDFYHIGRRTVKNGTFKSDYLKFLERGMKDKIPGMTIKAIPHINSRVRTFKKQCNL